MDFSDIINQLAGVMVLALTTLVTVVVPILALYLKKKWGLEIDDRQRNQLVSAINNGIAYGAQVVKDQGISKAQAANTQVAEAKKYVEQTSPDALKYFSLTTDSDRLEKKIISQLPTTAASTAAPDTQKGPTP